MPSRGRCIPGIRFRSGRRGFVRTGSFEITGFLRQAHRALPHHLRLTDTAGIRQDQSLVVREDVFHSPFAPSEVEFAFHSRCVFLQEGEMEAEHHKVGMVEFQRRGSLQCPLEFREPAEVKLVKSKGVIGEYEVRIEFQGRLCCVDTFFILTDTFGSPSRQERTGPEVARIG